MTPADRAKLLKFCRLIASDQDGERDTAARMANKLAEKLGGWDAVLAQSGSPSASNSSSRNAGPRGSYYDPFSDMDMASMREAMRRAWGQANASAERARAERDAAASAAERNRVKRKQYWRAYRGFDAGGGYDREADKKSPPPRRTATEQQRYDELFNRNFVRAHQQGLQFPDFADRSQWDDNDLERLKEQMERKMREAGIWSDSL